MAKDAVGAEASRASDGSMIRVASSSSLESSHPTLQKHEGGRKLLVTGTG